LVTLVVRDLERSRGFYIEGLGWTPELDVPGEVVMIRTGDRLLLSLWQEDAAVAELGPIGRGEGPPPLTLAHNVGSPEEVDAALAAAGEAGATIVADAVAREWGGYSGYFADPDGFRWEIAYNPGPIGLSVL
jgi:hypothetical protein